MLGTDSLAYAGYGMTGDTVGNFDLAAIFGDGFISDAATGANFLVDILPSF